LIDQEASHDEKGEEMTGQPGQQLFTSPAQVRVGYESLLGVKYFKVPIHVED
jgi:hypothetical protein